MNERAVYMFFFFNDTATTEIYTLSLHDALPISEVAKLIEDHGEAPRPDDVADLRGMIERVVASELRERIGRARRVRSEERTSELQSRQYLVCRLLLEKKNNYNSYCIITLVQRIK